LRKDTKYQWITKKMWVYFCWSFSCATSTTNPRERVPGSSSTCQLVNYSLIRYQIHALCQRQC